MIEMTANINARRAFEAAHAERARVIREALGWLFPSRASGSR